MIEVKGKGLERYLVWDDQFGEHTIRLGEVSATHYKPGEHQDGRSACMALIGPTGESIRVLWDDDAAWFRAWWKQHLDAMDSATKVAATR